MVGSQRRKITLGNNVQSYWGVQNIEEAVAHCLKSGAQVHSEIRDVGEGIKVAMVTDPYVNIFGLIKNPHFKMS